MHEDPATGTRRTPTPRASRRTDGPTDLIKTTRGFVQPKTMREFTADQCTDLAAGLTYFAVLALFPALLAVVSLLGLLGQQGNTQALLGVLRRRRRGGRANHS